MQFSCLECGVILAQTINYGYRRLNLLSRTQTAKRVPIQRISRSAVIVSPLSPHKYSL